VPVELVWRPRAEEDLLDIYATIGRHDFAAAERTYSAIEVQVGHLANHPRLGPRRPDIRPNMRILVERPYMILYRTIPDTDDGPIDSVVIVRIIDGRRDLRGLLGEGDP
jgi:toxin ParE1/3/4